MRENRTCGSEGGGGELNRRSLPLSAIRVYLRSCAATLLGGFSVGLDPLLL
jgi:hypothetical protein